MTIKNNYIKNPPTRFLENEKEQQPPDPMKKENIFRLLNHIEIPELKNYFKFMFFLV